MPCSLRAFLCCQSKTSLLQNLRIFATQVRDVGMVIQHNVKGYDEFYQLIKQLEKTEHPIHVLFTGESWCPFCTKAEPIIHSALCKAIDRSHFVHVDVGERAYWRDANCPFRKDPDVHLVFLPTLMRWKRPQRLDGARCANLDLVEMMLSDEE